MSEDFRAAVLSANPGLTEQTLTEWMDAALLAGPAEDLRLADIPQPPLQFAQAFAKDENEQVQRFVDFGSDKDERRRAGATRMLLDLRDPIHDAQRRAAVSTDDILALGPDGLTEFMLDLPSRAGVLELSWLQHDDTTIRWQPNDLNDIVYLSVAVAYCDVVVTERKWAHLFKRSGLPERFGTLVLSGLADLVQPLVDASVAG